MNGERMENVAQLNKKVIDNKPKFLKQKLIIGYFVPTWGKNIPQQFHGSVSNVCFYSWRFIGQLKNLSSQPCETEGDYMSWSSMAWTPRVSMVGVQVESSSWEVCHQHETTDTLLALPIGMTQAENIANCKMLSNGTIFSSLNITDLDYFITWFNQTASGACTLIWTPYSDEEEEDRFLNLLDDSVADLIPWVEGQPNQGRLANALAINMFQGPTPIVDVSEMDMSTCGSCVVDLALILRLRGVCKFTFLGEKINQIYNI